MAAKEKTTTILSENLFPVIGVGASAGGLEAFREFVRTIPENSGMAYILVQHLAPQYESILPDIIQKATKVPVIKIVHNIKVAPDHIYIIPSNKVLIANDGVLLLTPLNRDDRLHAIDAFFTSLAEIHQEHAIGVVLSGTGTDGTAGLKNIKNQGGITIVESKETAAYYGMPQSAIDADVVDYILPPAKITGHLLKLVRASSVSALDFMISEELREDEIFRQILTLLQVNVGMDFTFYKQTMIRRRILRRLLLNEIENLKDYLHFISENKTEQDALFRDLLIPVTAFFRDPKTFAALSDAVFPVLFRNKAPSETIRIWIAGCSTGEEAYSMAICLHEYITKKDPSRQIKIFATDISEELITKARSGIYKKKDLAGISEKRTKQYFNKVDSRYQVNQTIREMCVFATQNFVKDPPFTKLDLISCRNVLIYMEPYLQKKTLNIFHYALNFAGFLLLGKTESASQYADQFQTFSRQDKIYTKTLFIDNPQYTLVDIIESTFRRKDVPVLKAAGKNEDLQKAGDEAILANYSPAGVIVNEQLNILQFRGSTGHYLEAPPGIASLNILKMARPGLSFDLRNALHQAKLQRDIIRKKGISMGDGSRRVDIEVIPLLNTIERYFLVLFSDTIEQDQREPSSRTMNFQGGKNTLLNQELIRIEELEQELARVHQDMRSTLEDQDTVNEELQNVNEELLAGSEELQSVNEELETSKEELQSSNEELTILNQELLERNEQLIYARQYAEAIVSTIHEPLVILTRDLRVKSANRAFYETFQTTEQQTEGRVFFDLGEQKWNIPDLREKLNKILPDHVYFEGLEIKLMLSSGTEVVMMLNARQLANNHSNEQLILLAIHNITERKTLEKNQEEFAKQLEQQVLERTSDLNEANRELRYSNDNLQQFASIASHDLQEPLRKIKTFTAILNKKFSAHIADEGRQLIGKIKLSADRMSQLIREVLEYSKLTHTAKEYVPTDLDVILQNVLNDLDLLLSENGAIIHYKNRLPVIDAIPLQMNQLFYNVLINAVKFQKVITSLVVNISFKMLIAEEAKIILPLKESVSYIEIVFSDNGIGFEQQFAVQIFQIFERLHSTDEYEGTGVGLALCKKIVENHHGHIFAESEEGKGASFHVMLPVKQ